MTALSVMVGMMVVGIAAAQGLDWDNWGIYADGHWDLATKLTTDNVDSFVKENVDTGKTVFVRWIESESSALCKKQAPNWNKVLQTFKGNPDVVFGEVSLFAFQSKIREIHGEPQNPGEGGWPTVRHFNKETGYGGKAYVQKTQETMCDELGPEMALKMDYLRQYVEEAGGVSLCDIYNTDHGCTDKQRDFIETWNAKPAGEIKKQFDRLKGMADRDSSMKWEAAAWMKQRIAIYDQLTTKLAKEELTTKLAKEEL